MVSHYEERLEQDLAAIRDRVRDIGERVDRAFRDALQALLKADRDLATRVILGDLAINRAVRELDRRCHGFIVRHLPHAGPLRFVSSVLRINVALERIGDYAVTISRETLQLSATPPQAVQRDLELIAQQSWQMLESALDSFCGNDVDGARATIAMASQSLETFQKVYDDLLDAGRKDVRAVDDLFALLSIIASIGRVADQAKNVAEDAVFTVTGETKEPKVFRVLFIDEKNNCASQLAEAYARKAFPGSGRYQSAGWSPDQSVDPELILFMDKHGMDVRKLAPTGLDSELQKLSEYHVVVSLQGDARHHLPRVPYRTVLLHWDLPACESSAATLDGEEPFQDLYRQVALKVRELMETLRGPGAD